MVVMPRYIIQTEFDRRQEQAAIIIQAHIRKFLAIKMVDRLRYQREMLRKIQEKHAAIVIQRFYRAQRLKKYEEAAIVLQKHVRRFLATRYFERIKAGHLNPEYDEKRRNEEEKAAIKIQSLIRRFLATRRVNRIRYQREMLKQIQQNHSARVIQRFYRKHKSEQNCKFEKAAIVLQSHIRKFLAMRQYKRMKLSMKKDEEKMEVDRPDRLEDNLDEACDRLIFETAKAAQNVDDVGPLNKYNSAALTIQRSWRGYNSRRRNSDILEKLEKTRLSLKNAPNIPENPKEHRQMTVRQRIDIYLPLFYSNKIQKRQLAASFMNRITKNSDEFVKEFLDRDGFSAIVACSTNLGRDYADTLLQKELTELLLKCLNCSTNEKYIGTHLDKLLKLLVGNISRYRSNPAIMQASCQSIHKLCRHSESPGLLKQLKFPFYVSQLRKSNSNKEMLKLCEETLKLINVLPE